MFGLLKKIFSGKTEEKKASPAKKDLIGTITHYYGKVGSAILKIKNGPLSTGEKIRIWSKNIDFEQTVFSMEIDHKVVEKARKGQVIGLGVKKKVHAKDGVYRVTDEPVEKK